MGIWLFEMLPLMPKGSLPEQVEKQGQLANPALAGKMAKKWR